MFGRGYVIEHCVHAYLRLQDERRYRAYVTDTLMLINKSICGAFGGASMNGRWVDEYLPKDTRTADEVALDVVKNAGLSFKDGDT